MKGFFDIYGTLFRIHLAVQFQYRRRWQSG